MKIINIDMNLSSSEIGIGTRYLILDDWPNTQWQSVFRHLHKNSMDTGKRQVDIAGNNIVVNCTMDDIQYQIDSLNELCQQTDAQILAHNEESQRKERERIRLIEEKKNAAKEAFGKLKF